MATIRLHCHIIIIIKSATIEVARNDDKFSDVPLPRCFAEDTKKNTSMLVDYRIPHGLEEFFLFFNFGIVSFR